MIKDFKLESTKEKEVTLDKYKGKKLALFYYPKDDTKGCTIEAIGFRDLYGEFLMEDTEVVGMSRDGIKSHKNFIEKYDLNMELISDKSRTFAEDNDLLAPGKMFGKDVLKTKRTSFLFDENSNLIKRFDNVDPETHPMEVLEYIRNLDK